MCGSGEQKKEASEMLRESQAGTEEIETEEVEEEKECSAAGCVGGCNETAEEPFPDNITGVISIMKANGRERAAEFMEEIKETKQRAEELLQRLENLRRKRTGQFQRLPHRNKESS